MAQVFHFSAPGRTEISGNHTDHQHGCVLAAAVNLETVAEVTLNDRGVIAVGKEADLLIMDAPMGSVADDAMGAFAAGDIPGLTYVIIDGKILVKKSSNTPPAKRKPC